MISIISVSNLFINANIYEAVTVYVGLLKMLESKVQPVFRLMIFQISLLICVSTMIPAWLTHLFQFLDWLHLN